MRLIIQRVQSASVDINNNTHNQIKNGLLCFVGFCDEDEKSDFKWAINKISNLKLFKNQTSVKDICGELLVVSQFTLFASIKKGTKPSWSKAANPTVAKKMYADFIEMCRDQMGDKVKDGVFGADMQIRLVNDGPVTLILDTKKRE